MKTLSKKKAWSKWLNRLTELLQNYGWSIPIFGIGMLVGLSLNDRGPNNFVALLEIITALGTLGAAFAAFQSVRFSVNVQNERNQQLDEERKPYLRVTWLKIVPEASQLVEAQLTNMGQFSVWMDEVIIEDEFGDINNLLEPVRRVLLPGESLEHILGLTNINHPGTYNFYFYFTYAVTGSFYYRLVLSADIEFIGNEENLHANFHLHSQHLEKYGEDLYRMNDIGFIIR